MAAKLLHDILSIIKNYLQMTVYKTQHIIVNILPRFFFPTGKNVIFPLSSLDITAIKQHTFTIVYFFLYAAELCHGIFNCEIEFSCRCEAVTPVLLVNEVSCL